MSARPTPIEVECASCHRRQLRWSNEYPNGLKLEELRTIGWTWTGLVWKCPMCFEREHLS